MIVTYWRHRHNVTGDALPKQLVKKFGERLDPPVIHPPGGADEEASRGDRKKKKHADNATPSLTHVR